MEGSFKLENITLIGDGTAANGEYADFRKELVLLIIYMLMDFR